MGHLTALMGQWLHDEERTPAWLAGRIGTSSSTLSSWKTRGSRPSPALLRALSAEMKVDHLAVVAAVDADAGHLNDAELRKALASTRLSPALRDATLRGDAGRSSRKAVQ